MTSTSPASTVVSSSDTQAPTPRTLGEIGTATDTSARVANVGHGRRTRHSSPGQSLVEFALLLPLLILLLAGAIDFGRVFFGWIALQNAARVGANYAATHPDAWATGNAAQMAAYEAAINAAGSTNCTMNVEDPAFPSGTRRLGDPARVRLHCAFEMLTPFLGPLVGQPVPITAEAVFPIRRGCGNCGSAPNAPPPPPPPNCRTVPDLASLSVAGARAAWTAAGFTGTFVPPSGDDGRSIESWVIDQHGEVGCNGTTHAFFSSTVVVTLAPIEEPCPDSDQRVVPNLLGMSVAAARTVWADADFQPSNFSPTSGVDAQIVQTQSFTPSSVPGECRGTGIDVIVTYGPPPPPPPAVPCRVPSFVNTARSQAQTTWGGAGFTTTVLYHPPASNWTVIQGQSLVGGSWAGCNSTITVMRNG